MTKAVAPSGQAGPEAPPLLRNIHTRFRSQVPARFSAASTGPGPASVTGRTVNCQAQTRSQASLERNLRVEMTLALTTVFQENRFW